MKVASKMSRKYFIFRSIGAAFFLLFLQMYMNAFAQGIPVNSNLYSSEIKLIKTALFFRKNIHLQVGISSSSPLSTAIFQAGAYGVYGICSFSTDYNNSYRLGYGIGYRFEFKNNMGINLNYLHHQL